MKDGLFTLAGELDEPGLYTLDVAGARFAIVLDGREMMLYGDYLEPDTKLLKGSDAVKTRLALDQLHYESFDMVVNEGLGKYYEMIENEQIEEAEHKAKEYQALAVEQAKKLLSDAERQGQAALEQALREAEAQRREQDTQAEQAAQLRADAIMTEARRACDGLRRQAEERLADAAALIVRRVVGDSCLLSK